MFQTILKHWGELSTVQLKKDVKFQSHTAAVYEYRLIISVR